MRIRRHPYTLTYSSQNVTLLSNICKASSSSRSTCRSPGLPILLAMSLLSSVIMLNPMEALDTLNCVSVSYKNFYWRWIGDIAFAPFIVSTFAGIYFITPLVRKHGCKSIFYAPGIKVVYFNILQLVGNTFGPYLLLQSLKPWDCVGDRVDGHLDAKCASALGAWTYFFFWWV